MKRKEFLKYLNKQGCELLREGAKHSWWWNPEIKFTFKIFLAQNQF